MSGTAVLVMAKVAVGRAPFFWACCGLTPPQGRERNTPARSRKWLESLSSHRDEKSAYARLQGLGSVENKQRQKSSVHDLNQAVGRVGVAQPSRAAIHKPSCLRSAGAAQDYEML